jgi:hypothetical protein
MVSFGVIWVIRRVAVFNARNTDIQCNSHNEIAVWVSYLMHYFDYYDCLSDDQLNAEPTKFGLVAME